jgi:hypothetical protein
MAEHLWKRLLSRKNITLPGGGSKIEKGRSAWDRPRDFTLPCRASPRLVFGEEEERLPLFALAALLVGQLPC